MARVAGQGIHELSREAGTVEEEAVAGHTEWDDILEEDRTEATLNQHALVSGEGKSTKLQSDLVYPNSLVPIKMRSDCETCGLLNHSE